MNIKIYEAADELITAWQWGEPGLRNITDVILSLVDLNGGRVLDVGCGTGRIALTLARRGFEVDATDTDARIIGIANRIASSLNLPCNFIVGDFTQNRIGEPDTYDLVVCSEVIEHVESYQKVIDNIYRVLKTRGILILTTPHDPHQYSVIDVEAGHLRRFTFKEIKEALAKFHIVDHFTTGFPFYRFIRFLYPRILDLLGRKYSREGLWSSNYSRFSAKLVYGLTKLDNLFNRLQLGDCLIVKATKSGPAPV